MPLDAAFHLGLHCLLKYPFSGAQNENGIWYMYRPTWYMYRPKARRGVKNGGYLSKPLDSGNTFFNISYNADQVGMGFESDTPEN